tara:strand:- start:2320 stop:2490 length:171 start_codon:yes stop_codon:yes gene_type:complete
MGRLAKLKREHIKKVNTELDKGHPSDSDKKEVEVELRPSPNVQSGNIKFLNKMKNI